MNDVAQDTGADSAAYWKSHYDSMAHHESLALFEAEADDFFQRLTAAFPFDGNQRVLDFGSGLGIVAERLASVAGELCFWDYSENMLATARARLQPLDNAREFDVATDGESGGLFDLIVVNSVIQYMSADELRQWLETWRRWLTPAGSLIVSDVILPEPAFLREVRDSLQFAASKGFLLNILKKDIPQYVRYLGARRQATMQRYSHDDFLQLASSCGLSARILDGNLTYRTNRFSVLMNPAEAS